MAIRKFHEEIFHPSFSIWWSTSSFEDIDSTNITFLYFHPHISNLHDVSNKTPSSKKRLTVRSLRAVSKPWLFKRPHLKSTCSKSHSYPAGAVTRMAWGGPGHGGWSFQGINQLMGCGASWVRLGSTHGATWNIQRLCFTWRFGGLEDLGFPDERDLFYERGYPDSNTKRPGPKPPI